MNTENSSEDEAFSCYFMTVKVDQAFLNMINDENYKKTQHVVMKLRKFVKIKNMVTLIAAEVNQRLGVKVIEEEEEVSTTSKLTKPCIDKTGTQERFR